ncbi:protein DpdG [Kineococcus sp. SYSU DK005]|uniref:protein DpdG n=1 Tax=Kineococcus sp. SYSU DK005 TaxID=3383126 RepID=UPI003D7ED20A
MPLLQPPNVLPKGMFLIDQVLLHRRRPVPRDDLRALVQPSTLPLRQGGTSTFDACLKALRDLDLVRVEEHTQGEALSRHPDSPAVPDVLTFYTLLLQRAVLQAPHDLESAAQRDLLTALTWWCAQDPHAAPIEWSKVQELLGHDLGADFTSFPIGNTNPWQSFTRWALVLGFAEQESVGEGAPARLVPDITRALKRILTSRAAPGVVRAQDFLTLVRECLPVVDGGRLAVQMRPHWNVPDRRAVAGAVDRALSHAILRCAEDGLVELDSLSDAAKVNLSDAERIFSFSHVRIQEREA